MTANLIRIIIITIFNILSLLLINILFFSIFHIWKKNNSFSIQIFFKQIIFQLHYQLMCAVSEHLTLIGRDKKRGKNSANRNSLL